jgi:hypothetical protein
VSSARTWIPASKKAGNTGKHKNSLHTWGPDLTFLLGVVNPEDKSEMNIEMNMTLEEAALVVQLMQRGLRKKKSMVEGVEKYINDLRLAAFGKGCSVGSLMIPICSIDAALLFARVAPQLRFPASCISAKRP